MTESPDLNKTYNIKSLTGNSPSSIPPENSLNERQQIALNKAREWLDEYGDSSVVALQPRPTFIL